MSRKSLLCSAAALLVAGSLFAASPERTLVRVTAMTPAAGSDARATMQMLEWSDGTKTVAAARKVSERAGSSSYAWTIGADGKTFTARLVEQGSSEPETKTPNNGTGRFARSVEATSTRGYRLTYYLDGYDIRGQHAARTTLQFGWTECRTLTSVTIKPEPSTFTNTCTAYQPSGISLGKWTVGQWSTDCAASGPAFTSAVFPGDYKSCCSAEGMYWYNWVGPTDVPDTTLWDERMFMRVHASFNQDGDLVTWWSQSYDPDATGAEGTFYDTAVVTLRTAGLTCPTGPGPGGCTDPLKRYCIEPLAAGGYCVPLFDAEGNQTGSCCGTTDEEIAGCAMSKL
ncbi:MAG TPA: hypothetical protein VF618_08825 [Thermoanaerobaculia bacterium]